jgi:uncharacterized protein
VLPDTCSSINTILPFTKRFPKKENIMSATNTLRPTSSNERINSVDIIRGISLFGILLMNIIGMGLYKAYYDPTNSGGATGWDFRVWWINSLFFEGTMRGMFSMLFGAGIVLFTSRKPNDTSAVSVTDAYFRRITWLLLFGVIHAYLLLWQGDILYAYALVGLIAFSFRNWKPKHLIIGAVFLCLVSTVLNVKDYVEMKNYSDTAIAAKARTSDEKLWTKDEKKAVNAWDDELTAKKGTTEGFANEVAALNKGYWSIVMHKAPRNQFMETTIMYRVFFWDIFAMMLLGMAFLKNGILKAAKSNRYYIVLVLAGYSIGLTTNYFEANYQVGHQFSLLSFYFTDLTHELGRVPTTIGHIGLIMLFIKSGFFPFLQRSLAAVGKMAFSNYIMHSVICNIIFLGYGFGMYGKFYRHQMYYIVFSTWIFQLIASPIWLRYFRFGPLEWAWRSLTYWQKQPMKRIDEAHHHDIDVKSKEMEEQSFDKLNFERGSGSSGILQSEKKKYEETSSPRLSIINRLSFTCTNKY